jgi:pyruvate dehydrogenase E2 component (dihydrolipoamide acetyltransferase)
MDEYKGSTFTISNLGMFGVETFNPIINQPDSSILGVCAAQDELVMDDEGKISKHKVMRISHTFDHRLIDGSVAAKFECAVRDLLQNPMEILL